MTTKDLKFWLDESDLKTPLHDEMVLWTFNNAENILINLNILPEIKSYFRSHYGPYSRDNRNNIEWSKDNLPIIKENDSWHEPIMPAIDEIKIITDEWKLFCSEKKYDLNKTMEYPLQGYNGFNLGFIDLLVKFSTRNKNCEYFVNQASNCSFAFEIKPHVKSIGEVLRQFQYYKSNLHFQNEQDTKLILVTQTPGLKEIFENQGFYVVEYKKEEDKSETNSR